MDVPVYFGRDVARVRGEHQPVRADPKQICRLGQNIQVAMLAEKRQSGDGAILKRKFLHFGDFDDVSKATFLQQELEGRVLERASAVSGNDNVADAVTKL